MENIDIKQFQNRQSAGESQQLLMAVAVLLRVAYGELAATNALCGRQVFSDSECKKLEKTFVAMMGFMAKSTAAFREECVKYEKQSEKLS